MSAACWARARASSGRPVSHRTPALLVSDIARAASCPGGFAVARNCRILAARLGRASSRLISTVSSVAAQATPFVRCASLDHQVLESSTEKASPDSGAVGSAVVSRRHIRTTGSTRKVSTRAVCRCRASTASWAAATASSARPSLERTTPRLSRADARLCPWMSGLIRASRRLRSTASWAATSASSYLPALQRTVPSLSRMRERAAGLAVARRWLAMRAATAATPVSRSTCRASGRRFSMASRTGIVMLGRLAIALRAALPASTATWGSRRSSGYR